jgi:hypothetical protein
MMRRRLRHTVVAMSIPLASFIAASASSPTTVCGSEISPSAITELLQASRAALGENALAHGGVLTMRTVTTVSGLRGTGTSAAQIGGQRMAERSTTPPIATGDGYDGAAFWNQDQSGLVWTDGSEAGVSQEIDNAYVAGDSLFVPGSDGAKLRYDGSETFEGRKCAIIIAAPRHSSLPIAVWIDAATHLPARYIIVVGSTTFETDVSDYAAVDGLLVPHHIASTSSDGNASDQRVTSARIDADDTASLTQPRSTVDDFSIAGGSSTSIPFDLIDNHVYLNVMLNGKGPFRFVFDSGGSNLVDPAVAKEIGAVTAGEAQDTGTGSASQAFSYATIASLTIGNAELRRQVFSVEPVRKGFGQASGERVDGLIGFEVLARYVTTFDYSARTISLALPPAARSEGQDIVHFVFAGTVPQIPCVVDGIASQCTVDTGASGSVGFYRPFVVQYPQVAPSLRSAVGVNGFGVGGSHLGFMGRLRSLQLGDVTLRDLVAGYPTDMKGAFGAPFMAANLGGAIWKRFAITFDYGAETMALQPNSAIDEREEYDRSGLSLLDKDGAIIVYAVRPNTPAARAGLIKGDIVRSIDGAAPQSLEAVKTALHGAAGTIVQLAVTGTDGISRTVSLTLRDWV